MAKVRRQGGIFQEASLAKKVEDSEGQVTPNQQGLQAIGATSNQSAQALTAKAPILEDAVSKEDTLSGQQRLKSVEESGQEAAQIARQKAENIKNLGSMGARIQNRVLDQFSTITQGSSVAEINPEEIDNLFPDLDEKGKAALTTNLTGFITAITPSMEELSTAELAGDGDLAKDFRFQFGLADGTVVSAEELKKQKQSNAIQDALAKLAASDEEVSYEDALKMVKMGADQIGAGAALAAVDSSKFTMQLLFNDDDVKAEGGFENLDDMAKAMYGPDATAADLNNLSIAEFQQEVEDMRQAEFSKVSGMRAQLASTPVGSAHYQGMVEQMRSLGMIGQAGIEADMSELGEMLDSAHIINVGDGTMTVEEILSDEGISGVIDELLDPELTDERREEIEGFYGKDLTTWVGSQADALDDLSETSKLGTEFGTVQEQWDSFGNFGDSVFTSEDLGLMGITWDPATPVTARTAREFKQELEKNNLYQLFTNDSLTVKGLDKDGNPAQVPMFADEFERKEFLARVKGDLSPKDMQRVSDMSPQDIKASFDAADYLREGGDAGRTVAKMLDPDQLNNKFPDAATINAYKAVVEKVPTDQLAVWQDNADWVDLVKNHPEIAQSLNDNPETYDKAMKYAAKKEQYDKMGGSVSEVLDELTGDYEQFNKDLGDLAARAKWDPASKKKYDQVVAGYDKYPVGAPDGKIDDNDADIILKEMQASNTGSFKDFVDPDTNVSGYDQSGYKTDASANVPESGPERDLFNATRDDGVLDVNELQAFSSGDLKAQRDMVDMIKDSGMDVAPLYDYLAGEEIKGIEKAYPNLKTYEGNVTNPAHMQNALSDQDVATGISDLTKVVKDLQNKVYGNITEPEREKFRARFNHLSDALNRYHKESSRRGIETDRKAKVEAGRAKTVATGNTPEEQAAINDAITQVKNNGNATYTAPKTKAKKPKATAKKPAAVVDNQENFDFTF